MLVICPFSLSFHQFLFVSINFFRLSELYAETRNEMESVPNDERRPLGQWIQSALRNVNESKLKEFTQALFPVVTSSNAFEWFEHSLSTFYEIRLCKKVEMPAITKELLSKSEEYGVEVKQAMAALLQGDFCSQLKTAILTKQRMAQNKQKDKDDRKTDIIDITKKDYSKTTRESSLKSGGSNKHMDTRKNFSASSEVDFVNNLADRGICICEKEVVVKEGSTFSCVHCGSNYHLECMKKKAGTKYCVYCHLRRLLPNRETKKVLFMGVLRKGKKRHEFTITLQEEDLSMKYRLQVRSFRVKQTTQSFILFPDYANIAINNYSVKEFMPLHRQSSLKYRKDEPFFAEIKHLLPKDNKLVITERIPAKENREERLEPENHVIGFFMIEERKIEPLLKEIIATCLTSFEESKGILQLAFRVFNSSGSDEVSCQVLKIPLSCSLSSQKIRYPARGIFCTHFHCFDLYNYVMMTSQSVNPRWMCPLCKLPCYSFKIDSILLAILQEYKQCAKVTEVMFFKTGQFTVQTGDDLVKERISNIHELPIENHGKRAAEQLVQPERKKRRVLVIPANSKVISLDE